MTRVTERHASALRRSIPALLQELNSLRKVLGDSPPPEPQAEDEAQPKRRSVKDALKTKGEDAGTDSEPKVKSDEPADQVELPHL
jgi:hypothetical protein